MLDAVIAAAGAGTRRQNAIGDWFRTGALPGRRTTRGARLVYDAIRACGPVPATGRAAMLRLAGSDPALAALFDGGSRHAPAPIAPGEAVAEGGLAPDWLVARLAASGIGEGRHGVC